MLAWNLTGEISAAAASNDFSRQFLTRITRSAATGSTSRPGGSPTLYLGQRIVDPNNLWLTEFWNRSLKYIWSLDGTAPGPGPTVTPDLAGADGRLYPSPKGVVYAVTDPGVDVVGTVVVVHTHKNGGSTIPWRLVKIAQPLRLAHAQTGIEPDGWIVSPDGVKPAKAAYSQFVTPGIVAARRG